MFKNEFKGNNPTIALQGITRQNMNLTMDKTDEIAEQSKQF